MGKKSKTAKKPKSAAPHLREDVCGLSLVATSAGSEWTFAAKSGALAFTEEAAAGLCVGTLRWSEGGLPRLPPPPAAWTDDALEGWRTYVETRLSPDSSGTIRIEPPMLDGLSYPLSLAYALQALAVAHAPSTALGARLRAASTILVIGASSKAEARLLWDSNYWEEMRRHWPAARRLVFVGPEIAAAHHERSAAHGGGLASRCFRGTLGSLLTAEPTLAASSIVVGFNTGMGSGLEALMRSWLPDLLLLLRLSLPSVFTCANDYSDLRGELTVFKNLLGANVALRPQRNPFKAATIVREPGAEPGAPGEWSCSSIYLYAVHGRRDDAPPLPEQANLEAVLGTLAQQLRETQTPSPVP
jgi:hypothetical protein